MSHNGAEYPCNRRPDPAAVIVVFGAASGGLVDDYRVLSDVLSEFARTMLTDFPIQRILDHLVVRIVDVLPVTAAGVTLISPEFEPRHLAASDPAALMFERTQTDLKEGPCIEAFKTGKPVEMPDLRLDERFPEFSRRALEEGLRAVFTFPLRHGEAQLGALDLYRDVPGEMSSQSMIAAQSLADVASAYLLNAQARDELKDSLARTHHMSIHDPLTGLVNRHMFVELLTNALARERRTSRWSTAVMFVDLDRFKAVNDTYGHQVGDDLLRAVAHRLRNVLRPVDTIARFGGDEFVVLCDELATTADALLIAERLISEVAEPFGLGEVQIAISASIGVAFAQGAETEQILQDADAAMYQAKRNGGASYALLDTRAQRHRLRQASTERDHLVALERREFHCEYQPIVATVGGGIVGAEALLRWQRPGFGAVSPSIVIPMAERSGEIQKIGQWVLEEACRARHRWQHQHGLELQIAVNVSAHQLMSPGYLATVQAALEATGTDPKYLTLELTESVFVHDSARALVVLGDLRAFGVTIALDDFGTGFSSLSYLKHLAVDTVKIDQTFISDLDKNRASYVIVDAVTQLAHTLGLSVTAEGVETAEQFAAVAAIGCDTCQGFYFARPSPAVDIPSSFRASDLRRN